MVPFKIIDCSDSFQNWVNKDYIPNDLKESLAQASILILPLENFRDYNTPLFPATTEKIYQYFKENLPKDILIDICIKDEDYQEIVLNSDSKKLGTYLVKKIVLTVFLSVFSNYVYDNYVKYDDSKPQTVIIDNSKNITINNDISTLTGKKYLKPTNIEFKVTIVDNMGNSKEIHYDGPAKEIHTVLNALKEYEEGTNNR